jgi:CBS domain containing-hemolysin-like protein
MNAPLTVDVSAHSEEELRDAALRPHELLQLVLTRRERLFTSVARAANLWWLVGALLAGTVLYAIPFGFVLEGLHFWKVPALLLGSVAICAPSLHVVGAFVGTRLTLPQTLSLSLLICSVASLFTFGFFPIMWFLGATVADGLVTARGIAGVLLSVSVLAGVVHSLRSQHAVGRLREFRGPLTPLFVAWTGLFLFITWRLASVLEL